MIEFIKYSTAVINLLTLILLGNYFDSAVLFAIVSINSLSNIIVILHDKGLSHLNTNIKLGAGLFYLKRNFLYESNSLNICLILLPLATLFFVNVDLLQIILFALLQTFANFVYLRTRLVKVRDGEYLRAAVLTELIPSTIKLISLPLIAINLNVYLILITLFLTLFSFWILRLNEVKNILQISISKKSCLTDLGTDPKINYLYGVSVSLKNYGIGSILSIVDEIYATFLFFATRLNQTNVILVSGIVSRVPNFLRQEPNIQKNYSIILSFFSMSLFLFLLTYYKEAILNIFSFIFFGEITEYSQGNNFLYIILIMPIIINLFNSIFQSLGRLDLALVLEVGYIASLIIILFVYGIITF